MSAFHIVVLEGGLLLVRDRGQDWRALQEQFADFKTSLGPADLEDTLDVLLEEWPDLAWREAEIRLWANENGDVFDLEGPAIV